MEHDLGLLYRTYEAFNARDIDGVLATMTEDVDWPNGWMGGRLRGKAAIRAYWTRQWEEIDPTMRIEGFTILPDRRLRLDVRLVVRDRAGAVLSDGTVGHVYTFREGWVARMDVE